MSLATPEKVRKLQMTLNAKAKGSPSYRFYALYDKIYREDVLLFAYRLCKANGGAAGVDGMTLAQIERYGRERWLDELAEKPTEAWTHTPGKGCASGCVKSIRCRARESHGFQTRFYMIPLDLPG